ncbi:7-carboxy-7-deazaguanine synthase QueE [Halarcobacter sp.]|uniref:7-carboxy-7-deazaguanine synthase QueE n=1 Tax=Halarcobacter sp. TaxID=2321133 RepID=UPI0029F58376|nr:7-carboxy-7-deazaguanine synthase QueE [Halarcobacter sp.]
MLEINEIFGPTIQGEGKLVGTPSIFIRFGKCNMKCVGFNVEYETPSGIKKCSCDSYYAVDTAFKDQWHKMSTEDIIKKVEELKPNYNVDIVITGGEPLLYWNNEEFQSLLKYYIENNYKITIETNASLDIEFTKEYQKEILFSMSVKLSNSLEPIKKRINNNTLTKILENTKDSYLKFVIDKKFIKEATKEIDNIVNEIPKAEVYLMPMGDTAAQINENSEAVIDMAIEKGYKYCDRLHIRVWDNKRGV